ncbi:MULTISPECIES: hypothetical protein [unclassified Roseovarius]|uniref:hypothetical protein n=1 Tax=unclassified Roseovarius TaxID=2614913 RepID=UPI00273EBFC6|nr:MULTISPECIES: hypothetical protein [unclassified Roseovarius]
MFRAVSRYLILAFLALGLLLPQASGVMAGLGLADGRVLVICTGDGLRTLRIDDAGNPVEVSQEAELCALLHATPLTAAELPQSAAPRLIETAGFSLPQARCTPPFEHSPSQPRAPPTV